MSPSTTITTGSESRAADLAPAAYPRARLLFWNIRRELWENRSIVIAPFAAAGLLISAVLFLAVKLIIAAPPIGADMNGDVPTDGMWIPYMLIAAPVFGISLIVAIAYCLGALHGERRDRSILFWKSLPVSDLTTVLSKASIPLVLVPLISFVAAMLTQLAVFALALTVFPLFAAKVHMVWNGVPLSGHALGIIWANVPVGYLTLGMLYGLLATALWHAPIYAWLLLVGGWARRMVFLWAVAPVGGLMLVESIVFGTHRLGTLFQNRLFGSMSLAFTNVMDNRLPYLTPGRFVSDPGLWIGLAVAALLLGAAVLLRRYRQPI